MKVAISKGTEKGFVEYNKESKELDVSFPDNIVQDVVEEYLTTSRIYRIPESNKIDDFREEAAKPIDSLMHMELGLSSLWAETDVFVEW